MNQSELVLEGGDASVLPPVTVVDTPFAGARHEFACAECSLDQLSQLLAQLAACAPAAAHGRLPGQAQKLSVYARQTSTLAEVERSVRHLPAWAGCELELVLQQPASGAEVGLQLWRIVHSEVQQGPVAWAFKAMPHNAPESHPANSFTRDFRGALDALETDGLAVQDVARIWLYVGDINGQGDDGDNYQQINAARYRAFVGLGQTIGQRKDFGYPASTGIGQHKGAFNLSVLACKVCAPYRMVSLENRKQTSAFEYPPAESRIPPLFSRAVAVLDSAQALVLVSGTASILGAKSVHLDSAERQTVQTLQNIDMLLQGELLAEYGCSAQSTGLGALKSCVVYVKHPEHYPAVKSVCDHYLPPGIVVNYNIADVCRPDLLVEIEGVAIVTPGQIGDRISRFSAFQ